MTVNPLVAGLLAAALLGEPVTPALCIGLIAVFAGIWLATTDAVSQRNEPLKPPPVCPGRS